MTAHSDIDLQTAEPLPFAEPPAPPEQSPLAGLARAMRGRWLAAGMAAALLGPALAMAGYLSGVQLYESGAILRVFPQESNILYRTDDDSVLKTFDSFVKAETTSVASNPVMDRARAVLAAEWPALAADMTTPDLAGSITIKRNDSLITLNTKSRDAGFAAAKVNAVVAAYLDLQAEAESQRSDVRLAELQAREADLLARQADIRRRTLEVGGEYGIDSLAKAHVEKIAQIDALAARRAEVEATLAAMRTTSGEASADMTDDEIMRATLLDRALADLNFDRAKRAAELSTFLLRYPADSVPVRDLREQIAVIDRAMAERREQIKLLGQTGALTDTSVANAETSQAEIAALLDKVTSQLAGARAEARDLNSKRAELAALKEEADDVRKLLEETSSALEVIRLEAGRALPGYTAILSPAIEPAEPAEDSSKILAAAGLAGGGVLPFAVALILGLMSGRVRHSDALGRFGHLVPVLRVVPRKRAAASEPDRLRNALQLHPLRHSHPPGKTRVITYTRLDKGAPAEDALALARSFVQAGTRVLLIDADLADLGISRSLGLADVPGWREALLGQTPAPVVLAPGLSVTPAGLDPRVTDAMAGVAAIRNALEALAQDQDLILICAQGPGTSLMTELLLSASDLGLADIRPEDRKAAVAAHIPRLDSLPRQGGALVFTKAHAGDLGLPA
jgi:polysaccharide biosynthesis transport protein